MPGDKAGRRRVTADPPVAPGRACYKPRRVRAGSSPLVIAHMAVESARLVAGNEVTATMPAAGFRERAGYHRTRTTRCPRMGAVRVPGSTRHQECLLFRLRGRPGCIAYLLSLPRRAERRPPPLYGKPAGAAPRQHLGQPQAEGRCSACPGPFSARAALISGPTGAALHVASSPGCAGWLGAARAHSGRTFGLLCASILHAAS